MRTLIVSKPKGEGEAGEKIEEGNRKASFDLPVPPSAFAIPGRISAESIGPRDSYASRPRKSNLQDLEEVDTESDDENRARGAQVHPSQHTTFCPS